MSLKNDFYSKNTLFIGKNVEVHNSLPSTNTYLSERIASGKLPPEGTTVIALEQTQGRGAMGNTWQAEAGSNLTLSIFLQPHFLAVRQQFFLNMAISLSCCSCANCFLTEKASIKWPNDIYINTKKLGGILIQNTISNGFISTSIIGIGLNINQIYFNKNIPNPTSMKKEINQHLPLETVATQLLEMIEHWYLRLRTGKLDGIKQAYIENLFRVNEAATFLDVKSGHSFIGQITDIAESGKVVIKKLENGIFEAFDLKEIKYIL